MKCKRCHGTGRVNEARQNVPCPVCRWMRRAAEEIHNLLQPSAKAIESVIDRHYRAAVEEQAKGMPF